MSAKAAFDFDVLLGRAAELVAADWDALRSDAAGPGEAQAEVGLVFDAVRTALQGEGVEFKLAPTPLGRRVVQLLRRNVVAIVAEATDRVSVDELVRLLRAFEQVAAWLEPRWDRQFSDRLSGPDALDLVVEVAHDLRSPLTSILFLAETLKRGRSGPITPLQERQLGLVYTAAFGLSSISSDVIEFVRGGDRLLGDESSPFSVAEIFESVRDIVQPIAEEKGLEVLASAEVKELRIGQPTALSRVLLNLTTNALKFTDRGSVQLGAREIGTDRIEFSVRDSGRGIPPEAMALLFEPFRRRQKPGDYAFSGSGLGLSICRKLIETMGGELQVQTTAGAGTRFSFSIALPIAS